MHRCVNDHVHLMQNFVHELWTVIQIDGGRELGTLINKSKLAIQQFAYFGRFRTSNNKQPPVQRCSYIKSSHINCTLYRTIRAVFFSTTVFFLENSNFRIIDPNISKIAHRNRVRVYVVNLESRHLLTWSNSVNPWTNRLWRYLND